MKKPIKTRAASGHEKPQGVGCEQCPGKVYEGCYALNCNLSDATTQKQSKHLKH